MRANGRMNYPPNKPQPLPPSDRRQEIVMSWATLTSDLVGMAAWAVPDTPMYWLVADRITMGFSKAVTALLGDELDVAEQVMRKIKLLMAELPADDPGCDRLMVARAFLVLGALVGRGHFTVETEHARYTIS